MKDAVATMGNLLPDDAGGRDAVHIAVFSAFSDETVRSREAVALTGTNAYGDHKVSTEGELIGIVDPFLPKKVLPGQRFWVFLYPRTITSLAHQWKHPAFEENTNVLYVTPSSKLNSEKWLRNFCEGGDCPSYETLIHELKKHLNQHTESFVYNPDHDDYDVSSTLDGDYFYFRGTDAHSSIPPEFWDHMEVVLGCKITKRPEYFSCSC